VPPRERRRSRPAPPINAALAMHRPRLPGCPRAIDRAQGHYPDRRLAGRVAELGGCRCGSTFAYNHQRLTMSGIVPSGLSRLQATHARKPVARARRCANRWSNRAPRQDQHRAGTRSHDGAQALVSARLPPGRADILQLSDR
jgi:hypothetical protein